MRSQLENATAEAVTNFETNFEISKSTSWISTPVKPLRNSSVLFQLVFEDAVAEIIFPGKIGRVDI